MVKSLGLDTKNAFVDKISADTPVDFQAVVKRGMAE